MKKLYLTLIGVLLMFSVGAVMAGDPEPPPPPHEGVDCSPGYWKNHTEVWFDICCVDAGLPGIGCDLILINLRARGPGSNILRSGAAEILNNCFPESPCE